jgi:mannose-6-phosphate isomerase-like protein (cupin superfamily)
VPRGRLKIRLREMHLKVEEGQFMIIRHCVEHWPVADPEVQVLLLEPKSTVNTGDEQSERTVPAEWI